MGEPPSVLSDTSKPQTAAALRWTGTPAIGALAVAASALILIWSANRFTFFDDEAFSLRRYILPMSDMVSALGRGVEPDPPLYYIIENAWIVLVGVSSPLLMRIPSIVFFIAGLIVLRPAVAAWFGEPTGRTAQVLAALHPAHLLFGMAARWYSLMFLAVAVLLWMTAVATRPGKQRTLRCIGWSLAAVAVCYTNYFGVAVVGLTWIVGALRVYLRQQNEPASPKAASEGALREWLYAAFLAVALFGPWLPTFYRQLIAFPRVGGGVSAHAASAGRTAMALTSGNLASPGAWWVHGPLVVFVLIVLVLTARLIRRVWPLATLAGGSVLAGITTQTMLDKYVLSLSGPACALVAAVLVISRGAERPRLDRRLAQIAWTCLCIGWFGCGVHLVTGRYWSSLRWLDPFDDAATVAARATMGGGGAIVTSHPAAAYYAARCLAGIAHPDGARPGAPVEARRAFQEEFDARLTPSDKWLPDSRLPDVLSPLGGFRAMEKPGGSAGFGTARPTKDLRRIVVVEAAEFQNDAGWSALRARLAERYSMTDRRTFLPDPDAALKDRLDPRFKHPRFRIEVQTWDLK